MYTFYNYDFNIGEYLMSQRVVFLDINKMCNVLQMGRIYHHRIQGQPSEGEQVKMTYSIKHSLKFFEKAILVS